MRNQRLCPDELSDADVAQYRRDGYLAFDGLLTDAEVADASAALSELTRMVGARPDRMFGHDSWLLPNSPIAIEFEAGYAPSEMDADEVEMKVRKYMWFASSHPFLEAMANRHPRISPIVRSLLGDRELLMQDMALVKPPYIGREKPWHQDGAYFAVLPLDSVVGVWIALDDAAPGNGCMHVIPGGHLPGPRKHSHINDCEIPRSELPSLAIVPVPLPPGGALFFSGLLPHQTPPNSSPLRRRALQFHYRAESSRVVDKLEYDTVFADTNGPASCAAAPRLPASGPIPPATGG